MTGCRECMNGTFLIRRLAGNMEVIEGDRSIGFHSSVCEECGSWVLMKKKDVFVGVIANLLLVPVVCGLQVYLVMDAESLKLVVAAVLALDVIFNYYWLQSRQIVTRRIDCEVVLGIGFALVDLVNEGEGPLIDEIYRLRRKCIEEHRLIMPKVYIRDCLELSALAYVVGTDECLLATGDVRSHMDSRADMAAAIGSHVFSVIRRSQVKSVG